MRVIFTFDEIKATNELAVNVFTRCKTFSSKFSKLEASGNLLEDFSKFSNKLPEIVKIDNGQRLVIITIPEDSTIEIIESVSEFYMDLLDVVPMIMTIFRLIKTANKRYVGRIEAISTKFVERFARKPETE